MTSSPGTQILTVGKVARLAGVGVETIRFYERENLLPKPARAPSSGYRLYSQDTVQRLAFISRAKELGFTLRETRELLGLRSARSATCESMRARAQDKLDDVRRKIETLQRIEAVLEELADTCPSTADGGLGACPILAALERTGA